MVWSSSSLSLAIASSLQDIGFTQCFPPLSVWYWFTPQCSVKCANFNSLPDPVYPDINDLWFPTLLLWLSASYQFYTWYYLSKSISNSALIGIASAIVGSLIYDHCFLSPYYSQHFFFLSSFEIHNSTNTNSSQVSYDVLNQWKVLVLTLHLYHNCELHA